MKNNTPVNPRFTTQKWGLWFIFYEHVFMMRKESSPKRSKLFPLRADPFLQRGFGEQKSKREVINVIYLLKMAENIPEVSSLLML